MWDAAHYIFRKHGTDNAATLNPKTDTGKPGKSGHPTTGPVGDERLASEGGDVVLAVADQRHVLQQDHVVVARDVIDHGIVQKREGVLAVTAEVFAIGLHDTDICAPAWSSREGTPLSGRLSLSIAWRAVLATHGAAADGNTECSEHG